MHYDYIIVGQGIAGSTLAFELFRNGKNVIVLNEEESGTSSYVAAGLFNPITGKKMGKTWMADVLFPYMQNFYSEMEQMLEVKFVHSRPIYKPFASIKEQNHWISYSSDESVQAFVNMEIEKGIYAKYVNDELGGFETKFSGNIDIPLMLDSMRAFLKSKNLYLQKKIKRDSLIIKEEGIELDGMKADKIIFCEGHMGKENHFFKWLPFGLTKGEVLTVKINDYPSDVIFNQHVFMLPVGNALYKVGSTYQREFEDAATTDAGRLDIEERLKKLIKNNYEVVKQEAGIRPTVKDRRPMLGRHPAHKNVVLFNGLGTKGITLAPYFSAMLYSFLENDTELMKEVNIERFYSLYYNAEVL